MPALRETSGRDRLHHVVVVALALAASIVSLRNGFALDDVAIIEKNVRVHSLANIPAMFSQTYWPPDYGHSLYRPFTTIAFVFQWAAGNGSPLPFHVVSVALYAAVCAALLRLARQIMDDRAALAGAALFAVHPLHVEAVANVVGQAELWVALLTLATVSFYITRRRTRSLDARAIAVMSATFGAALMFKEHAIVLPAVIVAAELLLFRDDGTMRNAARRLAPVLGCMIIVAVVFVAVRTSVIGKLGGGTTATIFLGQGYMARVYTMLAVVPEWMRLFFWPASLSADYSPPRILAKSAFEASMIPGLLVIAVTMVIAWRVRREHAAVTFSLALAGVALLIPSNLVMVTGFVLAERSLFLASAGVSMAVGYAAWIALERATTKSARVALTAASAATILAGVVHSSARSTVWRDNETLFRQTVVDVPMSYRAHLMLGELLTDSANYREGLPHLENAVRLSRKEDFFVRWFAADRFHAAGALPSAMRFYREALALKPEDSRARYGAAMCLAALGDNAGARAMAAIGVRQHPADARFARIVHVIDSIGALSSGS
jgi:hypothetical protein